MKKIVLGLLLLMILVILVGCRDSYKYSTKQEKVDFIKEMYKEGNTSLKKEYEDIINKLEEKKTRTNELQLKEWKETEDEYKLLNGKINVDSKSTKTLERFFE